MRGNPARKTRKTITFDLSLQILPTKFKFSREVYKIQMLASRINVKSITCPLIFNCPNHTDTKMYTCPSINTECQKNTNSLCQQHCRRPFALIQTKYTLETKILGVRSGESILGRSSLCIYFQHKV